MLLTPTFSDNGGCLDSFAYPSECMDTDMDILFESLSGKLVLTSPLPYAGESESFNDRYARLSAETELLLSYANECSGFHDGNVEQESVDEERLKEMFAECIVGYDD